MAVALGLGCTGGDIGGGAFGSPRSDGTPSGEIPQTGEALAKALTEDPADATPLRRLTTVQYENTVRDLTGLGMPSGVSLPPDSPVRGFDSVAFAQAVTRPYAEALFASAEQLSKDLGDSFLDCAPTDAGCAEEYIDTLGSLAFRRPLTSLEREDLLGVFTIGEEQGGFSTGVELVTYALLSSAQFIYRSEVGIPEQRAGDKIPLTGYEIASRLSYFLWETMPDAALMDAADRGELATPEGIATQVDRMLADPRARQMVRRFHRQWLKLDRALEQAPDESRLGPYDSSIFAELIEESERFAEYVVFDSDTGSFTELLTAPYTFLNESLAAHYDLPPVSGGFQKVELDPSARAGILTQGALMAAQSGFQRAHPIRRGVFLLTQIMCRELKLPESVNVVLPEGSPDSPFREKIELQTSPEFCAGCHSRINPPGFALDVYDALGRHRTHDPDSNTPLDTTGELVGVGDAGGSFANAAELVQQLSQSEEVRECYANKWFLVAFGRGRKPGLDDATFGKIMETFRNDGYRIESLIRAITQTEAFRTRYANEVNQ
jgi:hypothetical protein